jgi:hypothetical protein
VEHLSGAPLLTFRVNIKPGFDDLPRINALAYLAFFSLIVGQNKLECLILTNFFRASFILANETRASIVY